MLSALSSAIVFGRARKNQHASATQGANLLLPNSIPRNGVTQPSLRQPIRCQLQISPVTSDVLLSLRQAHEKLRTEIRTAAQTLSLRASSSHATITYLILQYYLSRASYSRLPCVASVC